MKRSKNHLKNHSFRQRVLQIIQRIPRGKVLTYGQVAILAGVPRAARIVGGILYQGGPDPKIPWHRVINAQGKLSTYRVGMGEEQKSLLEQEGVAFNTGEQLSLKKHQWWPRHSQIKNFQLDEALAWRISQQIGF